MGADATRTPSPVQSTGRHLLALAVFILLCLAAGYLGSVATEPNIATWYAGLVKPPFNPPNIAFPVVWTILYLLMAVAAWLAWRSAGVRPAQARRTSVLVPFLIQLILNTAWSFAFFAAHNPWLGVAVIGLLVAAIISTIVAFARVSRAAAALLVPYLAWVAFAAALNVSIAVLN
jgi:tryptophan-rich sensory protein